MSVKVDVILTAPDWVTATVSLTSSFRLSFVLANALKLYTEWCMKEYDSLSDEQKGYSLLKEIEYPLAKEMYDSLIEKYNEKFPESLGNIKSDISLTSFKKSIKYTD
ncbi:MAG TPA: hypothetical protein DDX39_05330 [Bacteroidales bacterium]|nr:MAG: hypothetical protein A2W98_10850 [Bacteroidetes bacterium GWF2_33_38]OFY73914.1 MAG: hypothetical protein A2265_08455 [Bacteroidetes bacterium RIFOXYA12_FULL_33_9]OFY85654.1 MAG: hypothetical protein A2236_02535 [Bacteroidetes bacterium RIFOXYA2_FULL_33_7]HBF88046.1 hypothetical protein [Bacteroidales bacterium]